MFLYYWFEMSTDLFYTLHWNLCSLCVRLMSTYGYSVMHSVYRLYIQHNQIVSRLNFFTIQNDYLLINVVPSKQTPLETKQWAHHHYKNSYRYCSKRGQRILQFFFNYSPPVWLYSVQKGKHLSVVGIEEEGRINALSQIKTVLFWIAYTLGQAFM